MSKKHSIHDILEEQESNSKNNMWNNVENRLEEESHDNRYVPHKRFSWKKFCSIAASFVVVLGITLFSVFHFLPQGQGTGGTPSISEEPKGRYCTQADYSVQKIEQSIKEYSVKSNKNLLYLDWYEKADLLEDYCYLLNDTGEIICYNEKILNGETGDYIKIFITDNYTEIDSLEVITKNSNREVEIENILIKYGYNYAFAYSIFEYKDHRYFLEIEQPLTETAILDFVAEMIP